MPRRRYQSIFDGNGKDRMPSPEGKTADEFTTAVFAYLKRRLKKIDGGRESLQTHAFLMGLTGGVHLGVMITLMSQADAREIIRKTME